MEKVQHNIYSGVQPSSAVAERVFSLLQILFTKRQQSSLEDCFTFSNDAIRIAPFLYDVIFNYYNFLEYLPSLLINFWSIIEHNRLTLKA